jgi:[histone H3]-lysine79 N-trimethyltransferase
MGILQLFLDLREGTRIVSLKPFKNTRLTLKNINAIDSILDLKEYFFPRGSVSWMMEGGVYYIHTVDRTLVSGMSIL